MTSNNTARSISDKGASADNGRLSLSDRLALINLIEEGLRLQSVDSPIVADLFTDLWTLVDKTVSGSKIDRNKPEKTTNGFRVIELNAETGETLGRLHMLYLNKPMPCYYLVYVEVAAAFRNKGLGNRIVKSFGQFLEEKSAIGILDNIIPPDDPTFDIYLKQQWTSASEITGVETEDSDGVYMVYIPTSHDGKDLREPVTRLLHHLKRKRPAIDMRENELMVSRTIQEFKELYSALLTYFDTELRDGEDNLLMNFMFTRFVTKLLGFRHRIRQLLGFTGGESLEQIVIDPAVRALPVRSYPPRELAANPSFECGDRALWLKLPEDYKSQPARMIEALPNYQRPSLTTWLSENGRSPGEALTIGDLLDIGFDPTRLKELEIDGEPFILERAQVRLIPQLKQQMDVLSDIESNLSGDRVKNALLKTNPPLLIIRDRGNAYILRRKVPGIHWEEAVEQLQSSESLKGMNASLRLDKIISSTVGKTIQFLRDKADLEDEALLSNLTFFVSWDLAANKPKVLVDMFGSSIETIWTA
jgi:hypothetical protein